MRQNMLLEALDFINRLFTRILFENDIAFWVTFQPP